MVLVVFFWLGEGNLGRVHVGDLAGRLRRFGGVLLHSGYGYDITSNGM
jgi:hypothetical protein